MRHKKKCMIAPNSTAKMKFVTKREEADAHAAEKAVEYRDDGAGGGGRSAGGAAGGRAAGGADPFVVLSGSMEPTYPTGALIYVKKVPAEQIQVGTPSPLS